MKIHIIQHVSFETPGLITKWATEKGHAIKIVKTFENQALPNPEQIEFLIVLGGPMSANDSDQWIEKERKLIKAVVDDGKPMLGICLGAQQLAKSYGSEIIDCPKEVGWAKIQLLTNRFPQNEYTVLHWHGEGFKLPDKAERLFSTTNWKNQGFRLKNAVGLQFHLETTTETLNELVQNDKPFLEQTIFLTTTEETKAFSIPPENQKLLFIILDGLEQITESIS